MRAPFGISAGCQTAKIGWWISSTIVFASLVVALLLYGLTPPNLTTTNTQRTTIAPQSTTVGEVPKSNDRVQGGRSRHKSLTLERNSS